MKDVAVETVEFWPESMVVGVAEIDGAVSAGFTVTIVGAEMTITAGDALSVTWSSNDQDPVWDREAVEIADDREHVDELPMLLKVLEPGAFSSHWHP